MLPFYSAAPTPCSPLCPVVPDRPLFSDSAILSPYGTAPDDIVRGFASAAELPDPLWRARVDPLLMPVSADLATDAVVGVVTDDAAQQALMDAEMPTTFSADAAGVDESVARRAIRGVAGGLTSSVAATKKQAAGGVPDVSGAFQDKVAEVGVVAADVLRKAIVVAEDSLGSATTSLVYYYGSAKSSLPPNVKDLLNSSEEKANIILRPIGSALQQVYIIIEGLEKNVGLNPSDPIVQLAVLLGGLYQGGVWKVRVELPDAYRYTSPPMSMNWVGKTAIVEGLTQRIAAGNVPDTLVGARIVEVDMGSMVAGTHSRGMFEQRFKDAIKQAKEAQGKVILFIDEMHMVVGAGGDRGGPVDATNIGRSPWRSR
ncbi:Chaperone protein ClpB1 [Hordeum vulgare]|nr:Chaperone protein ClpB1 [Hordeum vulgare]